jgi:hypothetical protein
MTSSKSAAAKDVKRMRAVVVVVVAFPLCFSIFFNTAATTTAVLNCGAQVKIVFPTVKSIAHCSRYMFIMSRFGIHTLKEE